MWLMGVFVSVFVRVNGTVRMPMFVGMRISAAMLIRMGMRQLRMIMRVNVACFAMRMVVPGCIVVPCSTIAFHDDVDLGPGQSAAAHPVHLEARPYVQRCSRLFKQHERHARIHKRAQQHVAADAGETLQISDSHELKLYLRAAPHQHVSRQHRVQGPGTKTCAIERHVLKPHLP